MDGKSQTDHGPCQGGRSRQKFRAKYDAGNVKKYYSKFDVAVEVPLALRPSISLDKVSLQNRAVIGPEGGQQYYLWI